MTQDPSDPETLDEYLDDEPDDARDTQRALEDPETPEADAAEQRLELLRLRDTPLTGRGTDDADPADAAEQARIVDPGDEDYR